MNSLLIGRGFPIFFTDALGVVYRAPCGGVAEDTRAMLSLLLLVAVVGSGGGGGGGGGGTTAAEFLEGLLQNPEVALQSPEVQEMLHSPNLHKQLRGGSIFWHSPDLHKQLGGLTPDQYELSFTPTGPVQYGGEVPKEIVDAVVQGDEAAVLSLLGHPPTGGVRISDATMRGESRRRTIAPVLLSILGVLCTPLLWGLFSCARHLQPHRRRPHALAARRLGLRQPTALEVMREAVKPYRRIVKTVAPLWGRAMWGRATVRRRGGAREPERTQWQRQGRPERQVARTAEPNRQRVGRAARPVEVVTAQQAARAMRDQQRAREDEREAERVAVERERAAAEAAAAAEAEAINREMTTAKAVEEVHLLPEEEEAVDAAVVSRIVEELGEGGGEGVAELIRRSNEMLEIEPQGSLREQAEAVLSTLVGARPPSTVSARGCQRRREGGEEDAVAPLAAVPLADANFETGRPAVPESTLGGESTCIICFTRPKSHVAAPCLHLCACDNCSARMEKCPVCRSDVVVWIDSSRIREA